MEAQTTVSNSTQCGLFIGEYKKYTLSGVTFFFKFEEIVVHLWIVKMKFSSHLIGP